MAAQERKKPSALVSTFGFIFIICIVASILFLRNPAIQGADVAGRLQKFSEVLNHDAAKVGKQAALSYGAITLEGTGYDKYVVIQNLHFSLSAKLGEASGNWTLDTDKVSVILDPLNNSRIIFTFASPVTLTQNGQKTVISFSVPLKFGYFEAANKAVAGENLITLRLPSQITLEPKDTVSASPPPNNNLAAMTINYDGIPEVSIASDVLTRDIDAHSELRNIIILSGNDLNINIGAVAGSAEEKTGSDNKLAGNVSFTVSDFIRRGANGKAVGTCSLTSSIDYSSMESLVGFFGLSNNVSATGSLNKLFIACDDFNIKFEGNIALQPGDALPSGAATMTIDNVKSFVYSPLFSTQTQNELLAAMAKITGKPVDALTKVTIPLKRDPNGILMLGTVSAQDAGVSLINDWFHAQ